MLKAPAPVFLGSKKQTPFPASFLCCSAQTDYLWKNIGNMSSGYMGFYLTGVTSPLQKRWLMTWAGTSLGESGASFTKPLWHQTQKHPCFNKTSGCRLQADVLLNPRWTPCISTCVDLGQSSYRANMLNSIYNR